MNKINESKLLDIIGQKKAKRELVGAILSGHNILIVGPPGVGKTTFAKNISKILGNKPFVRVQGSPDLTSEDLLGDIDPIKAMEFGPQSTQAFTPGKIFKANKGVLFFDEINRAPEKLQNALLQVLQEKIVTISSYDVDFDLDFIFIATMNPNDDSCEKLSDVLLDRFDVVYMGYPENLETEVEIINKNVKFTIKFPEIIKKFVCGFIRELRESNDLQKVPSVRASISLCERAQAAAILKKKKKVEFEDLKEVIVSVLSHRIELKPNLKFTTNSSEIIMNNFENYLKENKTNLEKKGGGL